MINRGYTFSKQERLSSRKSIALLFEDGNSFFSYPFSVVWRYSESLPLSPAQVAISVPKKSFRRAVDRNRIKRITREAWRHQKGRLYNNLEQHNKQVVIMLIYAGKELPLQNDMNSQVEKLVTKFSLLLENET